MAKKNPNKNRHFHHIFFCYSHTGLEWHFFCELLFLTFTSNPNKSRLVILNQAAFHFTVIFLLVWDLMLEISSSEGWRPSAEGVWDFSFLAKLLPLSVLKETHFKWNALEPFWYSLSVPYAKRREEKWHTYTVLSQGRDLVKGNSWQTVFTA